MKRCLLLAVILLCGVPLFAQNNGAILPPLPPQFFTIAGVPASGAKLCFTASGTSNRLDVFSDAALTSALPEPVTLSAAGYPQTSGNAPTAIFIQPKAYRVTLYLAGTGNTCNGVTVGVQVWQQDNVYDFAMLGVFVSINNRQYCATGANFGAKFTAAATLLPSTGGIVDCSNLQGAQSTTTSDPFTGVTKPVLLIWPTGTVSASVSLTQPATMTWDFPEGGILSMALATTATINGEIKGTNSQHFAGSGGFQITNNLPVKAIWFGSGADNGAKLQGAVNALTSSGGLIDAASGMTGAAQTMTTQYMSAKDNVTVQFGCATWTLSGVVAAQGPPFIAANFQVNSAADNWFLGTPGCTTLKTGAGENANIFTFYSNNGAGLFGGGVRFIEGDGNKANNTAAVDDTFQSFVHIIQNVGSTADSRVTIDSNVIHDFIHYGVVTYGNPFASGNYLTNNWVHDNGKNGDANSTGDGIFINFGSSRNLVSGNRTNANKKSGIRITAAGGTSANNRIVNNLSDSNSIDGIQADEETSLGSTSKNGQIGLIISGNNTPSNTTAGIHITAGDGTGFIRGCLVTSNITSSNTFGILLQSAAGTSGVSDVSQCNISSNIATDNTNTNLFIGSNVLDTLATGNTLVGVGTAFTDSGTRTRAPCNITNVTDAFCNDPIVTNTAGALTANTGMVVSAVALSGGTATVTLTGIAPSSGVGNYACFGNDQTAGTNAVTFTHVSASSFTLTGTANDVIDYACILLK